MNTLRNYFAENKGFFKLIFFLWFAALVCGMYCAAVFNGERYAGICGYTDDIINSSASFTMILKTGITVDIKYVILIVISSSLVIFLPITCAFVAFKGFSAGFTVAFLIRVYTWKGAVITFFTIVLPYVFSLPIYFTIFISALKFPVERMRRRGSASLADGRRAWFEYGILMLLSCAILCVITFFEACICSFVMHIIK